jgi:DNA-binding response OmpR family regulator
MKILIVEDEKELTRIMVQYLSAEAYLCETAPDFRSALEKTETFDYDCVLLDISLPDGNGLEVLKQLKADNRSDGVIIISAKNSHEDRIAGLNLGADDYLPKPFHLAELAARIASVIRRRRFQGKTIVTINELVIDTAARITSVKGNVVELTRKEYDLLLYFISNKNRIISKNAIAEHLSDNHADAFDNFDFIYTHIKNLKRKLMQAGAGDYIRSVYGMGYKFST